MGGGIQFVIAILFILVILLLLVALLVLLWRRRRTRPTPQPTPPMPPTPPPTPQPTSTPGTPGATPNIFDNVTLSSALIPRLAGAPADGSNANSAAPAPAKVIWVDGGDEVLAHLDSVQAQIVGQTVLISIDLETDQTGRTTLVTPFALGTDDTAGLVAATDEFPRGNGLLAARWGATVQAAAWSALLALASDHAAERGKAPRALTITNGRLQLIDGEALTAR